MMATLPMIIDIVNWLYILVIKAIMKRPMLLFFSRLDTSLRGLIQGKCFHIISMASIGVQA